MASTLKRDRPFIRTRQRQPDFVRKAGAMNDKRKDRIGNNADSVNDALDEWALDYEGSYSVFED